MDEKINQNAAFDYDINVRGINHRGYSAQAPENTLPAYYLSKRMGFRYVETDVSFTSDNVAVLLHDSTINRTSNGRGKVSHMTFEQVRQYDFGRWKGPQYEGTKIPTFEEFISLCKRIGLRPYIELKNNGNYTEAQIRSVVTMVRNYGMQGKVTWISFRPAYLSYVREITPEARLGLLLETVSQKGVTTAVQLQNGRNEVFIDAKSENLTNALVSLCARANIPLEVWTVDSEKAVAALNPYITGVTSNSLIAGKVLLEQAMESPTE